MGVHETVDAPKPEPVGTDGRDAFLMLKKQMTDGLLPIGAKMPSVREISEKFGITRTTANGVLDDLAAVKLIEKRDRARAVVIATPTAEATLIDVIAKLSDRVNDQADEIRGLRADMADLRAEIADRFGAPREGT